MNEKKPFVLKEAGLTVYEKYLENAKTSNDSNNPRDFYISNIEQKKAKNKPVKKFLIEGHRGAGVLKFENTLAAFRKAIDLKLDSCELDIWLSKDKVPVVFHGGRKGEIAIQETTKIITTMTIHEIQSIVLPSNDSIPTLEELFQLILPHKLNLNLELKDDNPLLIASSLVLAKQYNLLDRISFCSYIHSSHQALQIILQRLQIDKQIPFAFLVDHFKQLPDLNQLQYQGNWISISWSFASKFNMKKQIQTAQQKGIKVAVFFSYADEENFRLYRYLSKLGINKLITNRPALAKEYIDTTFQEEFSDTEKQEEKAQHRKKLSLNEKINALLEQELSEYMLKLQGSQQLQLSPENPQQIQLQQQQSTNQTKEKKQYFVLDEQQQEKFRDKIIKKNFGGSSYKSQSLKNSRKSSRQNSQENITQKEKNLKKQQSSIHKRRFCLPNLSKNQDLEKVFLILKSCVNLETQNTNSNPSNQKNSQTINTTGYNFLIEGHSGVGVLAYENTISAFQKAIELKLDGIQVEIWLTKDNTPIVFRGGKHGEIEFNGKLTNINELTLRQIKQIELPSKEKIPTLEELLQLIKPNKLFVDLKLNSNSSLLIKEALFLIQKHNVADRVGFCSTDHTIDKLLRKIQKLVNIQKNIRFGYLIDTEQGMKNIEKMNCCGNWLSLSWELAKQPQHKQTIWKVKQIGIRIAVYFNFKDEETLQSYRYCQNLNVDKIITNRVKLVKNFNENIEIKNNMKQQIMDNKNFSDEQQLQYFSFDIEEIKDDDEKQPKQSKDCKPPRKRFLSTEETTVKSEQFVSDEFGEIVSCLIEQKKMKSKFSEMKEDSEKEKNSENSNNKSINNNQDEFEMLLEGQVL